MDETGTTENVLGSSLVEGLKLVGALVGGLKGESAGKVITSGTLSSSISPTLVLIDGTKGTTVDGVSM